MTPSNQRDIIREIDRATIRQYAVASSDLNPIHLDAEAAAAVGLETVIVHGMWTMGAAVEAVSEWAGPSTLVVACRAKFLAPIRVPEGSAIRLRLTIQPTNTSGEETTVSIAARVADVTVMKAVLTVQHLLRNS